MSNTFQIGDLVTPAPGAGFPAHVLGITYKVVKVPVGARGVNYVCERADGVTGRGIRGPAYALEAVDPDNPPKGAYAALVREVELAPLPPAVGTVVTVQRVSKIKDGDLYVVTAMSRKGGVRLSRLGGGDGDRYWPHIPLANITVVPLSEIGSYL